MSTPDSTPAPRLILPSPKPQWAFSSESWRKPIREEDMAEEALQHKRRAQALVLANAPHFRRDFGQWIDENWHVYVKFEDEAYKLIERGWEHFSARTIIEHLRHMTALAEVNSDFKLNNNRAPCMARLFHLLHSDHCSFFSTRKSHLRDAQQLELPFDAPEE